MAEEAAREGSPVCSLGPIIHNEAEIRRLEELGVRVVERPEECPAGGTLVIRAHGVGLSTMERIRRLGLRYIDATCPFVAKVHSIVAAQPPGTLVIVAGDPGHPEVRGITGHCNGSFLVIQTGEELENSGDFLEIFHKGSCILAAQTTFNRQEWEKTVFSAKKVCTNLRIFDTICRATGVRQQEAAALSRRADRMVVIGGRHSSNTRKLYDICKENCETLLIEEAAELLHHKDFFSQATLIGITAGASTPVRIIKEVQQTMSTMENISNDMTFEEMLDQSFKSTYNGEKVTGIVTGIKPNEIFVDIGTKHAGFVPMSELSDDPSAKPEDIVKVGDEIELLVVRVNDVEGTAMCSKKRLDQAAGFEKVMNAGETGEVLTGIVTEVIKGGILVLTNGIKVFVPASQSGVPRDGDLSVLLRKEVSFKILETNRQRRRALGSISAVLRAQREELAKKFWEEVEVGKVYIGLVKSITNFSVFVDLGGVDGRVGMTDLTWLRVKHPSEVVSVGDTVTVTVKDVDMENKKVSLIYKKSEDNPWEVIKTMHQVGDVVTVKVISITAFGAFAQIIPGIDGLIHISQIARERVEKVADKLSVGDVVEAKITELDYEKKRASLSIKALLLEKEAAEEAANAAQAEEVVETAEEPAAEAGETAEE